MVRLRAQVLKGNGVSPGVAVGRVVVLATQPVDIYRFPLPESEIEAEIARFRQAVDGAREELRRLRARVDQSLGGDLGAIFEAHLMLLSDNAFLDHIVGRVRGERVNAEWAVHKAAEELADRFARIEDGYLRERREDLRDVALQLVRSLQGISHHELSEIKGDVVIVADDLTPSDTVRLGREHVVGFVIGSGGRTSHTTIIARSLNLPVVSGLPGVTGLVTDDDPVIVDGDLGEVVLHPTAETLDRYRRRRRDLIRKERDLLATRELEPATRDGQRVELMANIDLPEEIDDVTRFGASGIGLYRSEFLYIEKSPALPTEEEHLAIYRRLAEAATPYPVIIRTYDLGGRKLARELLDTREDNPVLGLRGIRLTLARPDIFKTQLRALVRASLYGDLWVMIPLVSGIEEVRRFKSVLAAVMSELEAEGLPFRRDFKVGVMIEVPSAALTADVLAREVDFFSIGTNDLIQYSLAVDRNNEHVADLYQPLHPAILRMLRFVLDSALEAGIEVSVCGEMAGDLRCAPLLVGMGLRRLSVSPRMVPAIKTRIRELDLGELREMAEGCLELHSTAEVEALLDRALSSTLSAQGR